MLRAYVAQCTDYLASQFPANLITGTSCSLATRNYIRASQLHTSSAALVEAVSRAQRAFALRKANKARQDEARARAEASRPHPILGLRPGEEHKWEECELAKLLVDATMLQNPSPSPAPAETVKLPAGSVTLPKHLAFGVGEEEKKLLFRILPRLATETRSFTRKTHQQTELGYYQNVAEEFEKRELQKAQVFSTLLDLRNANAAGIAYENRRRIIAAFSGPNNPFDPGRTEVQGTVFLRQPIPSVLID